MREWLSRGSLTKAIKALITTMPIYINRTTRKNNTSYTCTTEDGETGTLGREVISKDTFRINYSEPKCISRFTQDVVYCTNNDCYVYPNTQVMHGIVSFSFALSIMIIILWCFFINEKLPVFIPIPSCSNWETPIQLLNILIGFVYFIILFFIFSLVGVSFFN